VLGLFGDRLPMPALASVCFLYGLTAGGWAGIHIAETARLVPLEAVTPVTSAVLVIGCAGLVLGPIAFGALAAATSFGTAYVGASACALAGVLALAWRPGKRRA
jgi:hypothetical protein